MVPRRNPMNSCICSPSDEKIMMSQFFSNFVSRCFEQFLIDWVKLIHANCYSFLLFFTKEISFTYAKKICVENDGNHCNTKFEYVRLFIVGMAIAWWSSMRLSRWTISKFHIIFLSKSCCCMRFTQNQHNEVTMQIRALTFAEISC